MGSSGHAFCWLTPIGRTADKVEWIQKQAAGSAFYRKVRSSSSFLLFHNYLSPYLPQNGFRRIGLAPFLTYFPDPSHASRKIAVTSDPETPSVDFESTNPTASTLSLAEIHARYSLHRAIGITKTPSIAPIIHAAHQADAGNVRMCDVYGLTPVYIAAASDNAHALCTLLSLDPQGIAKTTKIRTVLRLLRGWRSRYARRRSLWRRCWVCGRDTRMTH